MLRLVEHFFGRTVNGAGAGKDESLHAGRLGQLGDHAGGGKIDLDGQFFVEIAGRIADDCTQVDDRIHVAQRIGHLLDMAKIAAANFQTRVADHLVNWVIAEDQQIEQSDVIALFQ